MNGFLLFSLWPLLLSGAIAALGIGMAYDRAIVGLNIGYFALALVLLMLERVIPHEREWLVSDRQLVADLGHTALSKSAVQVLVATLALAGAADLVRPEGGAWWPVGWPLFLQILLGMLIAEFGFYWAHRLAHGWFPLWRFHAVHHSVKRLWIVNTGRFHFVDTLVSVVCGLSLGLLAGVPKDVLILVSGITAYVGLLTHCNVAMHPGVFSYFFNTPTLHRWHHSMVPGESNRNYGENLMIFDQLFGSFFNPPRRPPAIIGISGVMPTKFLAQLVFPFRRLDPQSQPGERL